jgi:hypothetical protein
LADSLYRDTTTGEWVGVPETTYTATMPDGTIPFTTVLRAGEGRLFMIAETCKKDLTFHNKELSLRQDNQDYRSR